MTADKYQQPHTCPLEERVKGLQSDVSDIRGMVGGMYDRMNELVETTGAIHDMVKYVGEPKYSHSDDEWNFLDEE